MCPPNSVPNDKKNNIYIVPDEHTWSTDRTHNKCKCTRDKLRWLRYTFEE